jgi:hypothetical protein
LKKVSKNFKNFSKKKNTKNKGAVCGFRVSEKADGCPTAKLPSDAKHRFGRCPLTLFKKLFGKSFLKIFKNFS